MRRISRISGASFALALAATGCNLTGLSSLGGNDEAEGGALDECEGVEPWDDEGARLEALTLERINEERRVGGRCGDVTYPPQSGLRLSAKLHCAARRYSRDMHDRGYVAPVDPDGLDLGARLEEVEYDYRVWASAVGAGWTRADDAVDSWLRNPNHCWKLFAGELHEIGVGVDAQDLGGELPEADTDGEVYPTYWTLVVGAQR